MTTDGAWNEFGQTVRYSLASNARTARLAILIIIVLVIWFSYVRA